MNRLFAIGDTHGSLELKKISNKRFPLARELDRSDVLLITGDAGFMWDDTPETRYWDDWAESRNFTIVTCFGNHCNYDKLRALPAEKWCGGVVRKVRPHIMYLENGELFNICGRSIFVQGGAASIDRAYRKEGKNWWSAEIPSYHEFEHAAKTLERANFNIDIILTHTAPNTMINKIDKFSPRYDDVTNFLDKFVFKNTTWKHWLCGHFHIDRSFPDDNFHFLYNDIIELFPNGEIKVVNN